MRGFHEGGVAIRYASLVHRIKGDGYDAWSIHGKAMGRLMQGEDVIVLSIGDPDFDTPPIIVEAAVESLRSGRTHYASARGIPPLRQAIASYYERFVEREGLEPACRLVPEQVVFFPGAQQSLFAVCHCLIEHGDEVIVPDPTYVTYEGVIGSTGATMVRVPLFPEDRFHLRPEEVERRITPRTRAILINNPHNPTGASLTRQEVEALGDIARQHDLWLIADEVYAALNYERPHVSPLSVRGIEDRVAIVSSLSKSHAMTGWRAGWAIAPVELADHLEQLAGCMCFGSPTFIQDASVVSLTAEIPELEAMRAEYIRRAAAVVRGLADAPGISCEMPEAGMFVYADIRGTGLDGQTFAHGLLDAEGVSLLPGTGFGSSSTGHVRISLAVDEERLGEACRRIRRFAARVAGATTASSRAGA